MASKVKLAFIGTGEIAASHLDQGLKDFPDVEFVGWCDLKEDAAAARREQAGGRGKIYTDAAKMLDEARPDAVYIMLPPFAHGPTEELVIARKLPFFVEKPVALDMATAKKIAAGVKRQGLITSVGYMTRYRLSVQRVRELLAKQKPVLMHGGWLEGPPERYEGAYEWWVQKDKSGGQFLEQACHTVDLARYLFGEVTSVYAVPVYGRGKRPSFYTIEDATMVQLTFASGAAANLYASCSTSVGQWILLTLWGTDMQAQFTGWEHSVKISLPGGEEISIPGEDRIFAIEDRVFVNSVKAGKSQGILSSYDDAMKTNAIACAANESMETGKVVKLAI